VSCDLHVSISNSHSLSFTTLHSIYIDFVPGLGSWHSVMSIVCDLLAAVKYDHGAGYTTPTGDLYSNALEPPRRYHSFVLTLKQLTLQSSVSILLIYYSRVMPLVNRPPYYISNAVFLSEILKLATSLSLALYDIATDPHTLEDLTVTGLFTKLGQVVFTSDSWKMALPAILYTLQTTLQYIGVSNLDDATFQVTSQLEMLVTAVLSVTMLGRSLSMRKWVATIILMVGIAIVQVPTFSNADTTVLSTKDLQGGVAFHSPRTIWDLESLGNAAAGQLSKRYATYEGIEVDDAANAPPEVNTRIGLVAVVLACSLSGVASAYSEKALKDAKPEVPSASAWVRNVQMSFYSIWPALLVGPRIAHCL